MKPKTRRTISRLLFSCIACAVPFSAADAAKFRESEKARFLAPFDPKDANDAGYWKLLSKKLFLTPGSYGRIVTIPSFKPEWVVSVDESPRKDGTGGTDFSITLTRPSSNLFYTLPQPLASVEIRPGVFGPDPHPTPQVRPKVGRIEKMIVPIDADFAQAIRKTWVAMLQRSQDPPRNRAIGLCGSDQFYFSVQMPTGRMAYAEFPLVTTRLPLEFLYQGLGLKAYCEGSKKERSTIRRIILRDLARLNGRLAKN